MKTLLLMRHAKAVPSKGGLADFDRALLAQGRMAAAQVGDVLKSENVQVDVALSSPAARARETIETVLQAAGLSVEVRYDQRLYEGGTADLLEVISEMEDDASNLLLVGHNPVLEELVAALTGQAVQLSPGTLAKINLDLKNWRSIGKTKGTLDRVVRPQELD
ncbi:MAG: histidine phosphatase family protein [Acidobacteriota bacterium]